MYFVFKYWRKGIFSRNCKWSKERIIALIISTFLTKKTVLIFYTDSPIISGPRSCVYSENVACSATEDNLIRKTRI